MNLNILEWIDLLAARWLDWRTWKTIEAESNQEAQLLDLQVSQEKGIEILLSHPNVANLAQECVHFLQAHDAPNFVQMDLQPRIDKGSRAVVVTVAYKDGEMPVALIARLKREVEELKAQLEKMRSESRSFFWNMNDELKSEAEWAQHYANRAQEFRDVITDLLQYRDANTQNFQLEKMDDFLFRLRVLLEKQP